MNIFVCTKNNQNGCHQTRFFGPKYSNYAIVAGSLPGTSLGEVKGLPDLLAGSAGLTIVAVVPWDGAPPLGAPRPTANGLSVRPCCFDV